MNLYFQKWIDKIDRAKKSSDVEAIMDTACTHCRHAFHCDERRCAVAKAANIRKLIIECKTEQITVYFRTKWKVNRYQTFTILVEDKKED